MRSKGYSLLGVSAALNALLWLSAAALFPKAVPVAILHYSVLGGVDFIGASHQIYILPLIGLLVLIGNIIVGLMVRQISIRSAWVLWASTILIQTVLIISFFILWKLNR